MKQSGFGITSMILGIISLLSSCVVGGIPIVLGILGIIFATVAMCQKDRAHGTAIAGLTCSIIGSVIGVGIIMMATTLNIFFTIIGLQRIYLATYRFTRDTIFVQGQKPEVYWQ